MSKPICYDGYCGLGGWSEGFLAEGYRCVGFDIEAHDYGTGGYPGELILRDMRQVHGSELKDAACLVFSPPCQEYSYMAMPWSRSKQMARALQGKDEFPEGYSGSRTVEQLNELFNTCFRIQREACEAAGHYIPMVVENVRGAQKWVGRAKAHYGSFYLWGDVGMVGNRVVAIVNGKILGRGVAPIRAQKFNPDGTQHGAGSWFAIADSQNRGANAEKVPGFRFDGSGGSFQSAMVVRTEGNKTPTGNCSETMWKDRPIGRYSHPTPEEMERHGFPSTHADGYKTFGMNWSDPTLRGQDFTRIAGNQAVKTVGRSLSKGALKWGPHNMGTGEEMMAEIAANQRESDAVKFSQSGDAWFDGTPRNKMLGEKGPAAFGSKSNSRKAASAMIAKIPFALSQYIAQSFKPEEA